MQESTIIGGRYQIIRLIARGGMAEVYLATDTRLNRGVAIKVLHEEFAQNAAFLHRFQREAHAMAGLNHPNMVQVYDYGQEDGASYIVMEYVRGKTMRDLLREQSTPPPERAAEVMADVAGALQYAHEHGIVHRDVKPANIMIDVDGEVKVADFGIAQGADEDQQLTQVGAVVGTAAYFSPEQAQGHVADARSDVYAMGCVLYELLTNRPPFDGETPWAIAYKHVNERARSPRSLNPAVPADLEAIVLTAMQKDPARRYQSATEMRDDLLRWRRGQRPRAAAGLVGLAATAVATSAAAGARTTTMPVAQQTLVQGAPQSIGVAPSGYIPGDYQPFGGQPAAGHPVPDKRRRGWVVLLVVLALLGIGAGTFFLVRSFMTATDTVRVPDVMGKTQAEAETRLTRDGFNVTVEVVANNDVEEGRAIKTEPPAGRKLARGATVTLFVSAGPSDVAVPDVVGKPRSEAQKTLEDLGFVVRFTTEASDEPSGTVVSQQPAGGTSVAAGSTIAAVVSEGPAQVTVPDVGGLDESTARSQLREAGFLVTVVNKQSDQTEGTVIDQTPSGGSAASKGSNVTITVAELRDVTVPNVVGSGGVAAAVQLASAGLSVKEQLIPTSSECELSKVCSQDPPGGTDVKAGTEVTIYIGKPPEITLPP